MKNQQRWLTNKLKGTWMDKDALLEICLFESLVHYVEKEKGLEHWGADWDKEIANGHVDQIYVDDIKARDALIKHCYVWIKVDRLKIVKNLETIEDWREYERVENELYDKDSEVMRIIIQQRGYLWT
jgi:hypothetical protein